jgi:hypothetical protein
MRGRTAKAIFLAAILGIVLPASAVYATTANVHATATFISNIVLTPTDMQFGNVSFNGAPAAPDTVVLTTAGGISYTGVFSSGGVSTISPGDVGIAGTFGSALDVSCSATATLAQASGSGRIGIDSIKVANLSAASGGGVACTGASNTVLTFTLTSGTDDHLKLGGTIDGSTQSAFAPGSYGTGNSGGADIQVDVIYH